MKVHNPTKTHAVDALGDRLDILVYDDIKTVQVGVARTGKKSDWYLTFEQRQLDHAIEILSEIRDDVYGNAGIPEIMRPAGGDGEGGD